MNSSAQAKRTTEAEQDAQRHKGSEMEIKRERERWGGVIDNKAEV